MLGFFLSKNICILFCYLLPAYQTWKSLKKSLLLQYHPFNQPLNGGNAQMSPIEYFRELEEQRKLLHYWIVVGMLTILEFYLDILVYYFPFYYELKIVFYIWLTYSKGAEILWSKYIEPKLNDHEVHIDSNLQQLSQQTMSKLMEWATFAFFFVQRMVMNGLSERQQAQAQAQSQAAVANTRSVVMEPVQPSSQLRSRSVSRDRNFEGAEHLKPTYPDLFHQSHDDHHEEDEESEMEREIYLQNLLRISQERRTARLYQGKMGKSTDNPYH
eukprot:TRINITY_DN9349_c0_g1_i1.p1 TRINITY_DN9349_c0_g1~~TRINITY_DN9349_c0_g1_i1.p1  ORF type:complete len:271 (-),score=65.14 TRINITY_DN9349_c0_g1_i1:116-928(-)